MNCEQYKDLIQEFHDGELPRESEAFLFIHLSSCTECREFMKLLNFTVFEIIKEKSVFPELLDDRILRSVASVKAKKNFLNVEIPAYVKYAFTLILIALLIYSFNTSTGQKKELQQMLNVLNEQSRIVKEQNEQLQMLMNSLPELRITTQLENEIIVNAKL